MLATLRGNEIVWVQGVAENGQPSGEEEPTTTQAIADLGGSGGINTIVQITNGATVPGALQTYYIWNSPTNAPKNIVAPVATGSGHVIQAIDRFGDAGGNGVQGPNPINFVPDGDDIVIGNQTQIYSNNSSLIWRDLLPGVWGAE